jgi:hypothetical protein
MPLILGANQLTAGGYEVDNSLRFNHGSSDQLARTMGTATDGKKCTISFWIKKCRIQGSVTTMRFMQAYSGVGNQFHSQWGDGSASPGDQWNISPGEQGGTEGIRMTNATYRDPSAWYHYLWYWDSVAQLSTLYVNGVQQSSSLTTAVTLNQVTSATKSGTSFVIKSSISGQAEFYLSEFYIIDGQALDPTDFGEFDSDTNIWKPIPYTGTFGNNGCYLEFKDSSALGDDTSGNGNDFTVTNLTSIDQTTDTCTNNFNTLNPLIPLGSNFSAPTEGNLSLSQSGTGNSGFFASTIIPSAGKWYFEVKATVVSSSDRTNISIANFESVTGTDSIENGNYKGISVSTGTFGRIAVTDGASTTEFDVAGYVPVANDIMIFAVDMDNSRVYIGKNGTWFTTAADSGGDPATSTGYFSPVLGNGFAVGAGHGAGISVSATNLFNFGNPPFTISSGNTDGAGFGNFEYAVPSGYYALCTKNLALYG